MKKYVIFLIGMFLTVNVFGQNHSENVKEEKYITSPKFIGSENLDFTLDNDHSISINTYVKEKIECPSKVIECLKEGTEIVQFRVNQCGRVSNFKVINSVCPELDDEVIRVLKTTNGLWNPGLKNGNPLAMDVEIELMVGIYSSKSGMAKQFSKKATSNFISGNKNLYVKNNPKKALRYYNNGINYMPNDKSLLLMRGLCAYEIGDTESAQRDWDRIVALGGMVPEEIEARTADLKGYEECLCYLTRINE